VLYLIVTLIVGIYYRSKSSSFHGYGEFSSKSSEVTPSVFVLMATIFATAVGGGTIFGLAEKSFSNDLSLACGLILTIPIDIIIAFYIVPKLTLHYGAVSTGDVMGKFYGESGRIIAGVGALLASLGYVAAQINVSGRIFEHILGFERNYGVIFSYMVVVTYTAIGGLRSVVFTNILQFLTMVAAIPMITIIGTYKIGLGPLIHSIDTKYYTEFDFHTICNIIAAALSFSVMGFYPSFIQRALMNKDSRNIKPAIIIKSFIYAFFIMCVTINGLLAFVIDSKQSSSMAIPNMIDTIIPIGFRGVVVIGLLAAVTSTASSDLNVASISIINDIFRPLSHIKRQTLLLLLVKLNTLFIGFGSIFLALKFNHVLDLIVFSGGFWAPMVAVPMVAGVFGFIIEKWKFIISSCVGISSFFLWEYMAIYPPLKGVFVGTIVNLFCFIISRPKKILL
nr:sodium:solute symporter family protein [Rickettsiaceae bacterium]